MWARTRTRAPPRPSAFLALPPPPPPRSQAAPLGVGQYGRQRGGAKILLEPLLDLRMVRLLEDLRGVRSKKPQLEDPPEQRSAHIERNQAKGVVAVDVRRNGVYGRPLEREVVPPPTIWHRARRRFLWTPPPSLPPPPLRYSSSALRPPPCLALDFSESSF